MLKSVDIKRIAQTGENVYIQTPMRKECKVAVTIPAYDEDVSTILRPLFSLAEQKGVEPEEFEVIVNVNNSHQEALKETKAFQANQKALAALKYLSGEMPELPKGISKLEKSAIEFIKTSGVVIHYIDKSSLSSAEEKNNVGAARNIAGWEAARRFALTPAGDRGVIAITDCECGFSDNYIYELIATFKQYPYLNGVCGRLSPQADETFLYPELLKRAVVLHLRAGRKASAGAAGIRGQRQIFFQKADNLGANTFINGQNMAVTVKVWVRVGGVLSLYSSEDVMFGRRVGGLPGDVAKNLRYTVYALIRASERAGAASLGRRIKIIAQSIEDYMQGRSQGIFVPDLEALSNFFEDFHKADGAGTLSTAYLKTLMAKHNFEPNNLTDDDLQAWVITHHRESMRPDAEIDYRNTEKIILQKIYPYFPKRDITSELKGLINGVQK